MLTLTGKVKCEVRALVSPERFDSFKAFFSNVGIARGEEREETRYFAGAHDLRIQKTNAHSRVWLKSGKTAEGDDAAVEIRLDADRFGDFERLFVALGYETGIIWRKHRLKFEWDGVRVSLDDIKGYGHVVEFWVTCPAEQRLVTLDILRAKMAMLGLRPTPKPVLHERFSFYRDNWQKLITEEMKVPA